MLLLLFPCLHKALLWPYNEYCVNIVQITSSYPALCDICDVCASCDLIGLMGRSHISQGRIARGLVVVICSIGAQALFIHV